MTDSSVLDGLNPQQREAVLTTEGPLLVLAGAGSGKTSVLTRRIAHLLEGGLARSNQILGVTFTNKAAKEMVARIECLCGSGGFPYVGTFHSVCAKWLRLEAELLDISDRFSIYDSASQQSVMKATLQELRLDDKKFPPRTMIAQVSRCKNYGKDIELMRNSSDPFQQTVARVYTLYNKKLHDNDALDFDDILTFAVRLLKEHPQALEKYSSMCKYVLVDEYQDVNPVQYELLRLLSSKHQNICAVGDDDQSIYGFRGADISIILSFEKDFPNAKVIKLEQNYRSTQGILTVANSLVACNSARMGKNLWSEKNDGSKPKVYVADNGLDEALFVVKKVRELCLHGFSPADITVLYRTNAQSRAFEEAFLQRGLAYEIVGGNKFYDRKEIKDVLAHLCLMVNNADTISVGRVVSLMPGVGETSLKKLVAYATAHQMLFYEALPLGIEAGIPERIAKKLRELYQWLNGMMRQALEERVPVKSLVEQVLAHTSYKENLQAQNTDESRSRIENLEELINVVSEFDNKLAAVDDLPPLVSFLSEVSLLSDQDDYEESTPRVTLMTIHTSKGLEFPVVFLVGLDEGSLPHFRSIGADCGPEAVEEERRLCYVGMTRARNVLFLTTAHMRYTNGHSIPKEPSRFLEEVPPEHLDFSCCKGRNGAKQIVRAGANIAKAYSDNENFGKPWNFAAIHERNAGSYRQSERWCDDSQGDFYEDNCDGASQSSSHSGDRLSDCSRPNEEPDDSWFEPFDQEKPNYRRKPQTASIARPVRRMGTRTPKPAAVPRSPAAGLTPRQKEWARIAAKFPVGSDVDHKVFGPGKVQRVERDSITVLFLGGKQRCLKESFLTPITPGAQESPDSEPVTQSSLFSEDNALQNGDLIEHVRLGRGIVCELFGEHVLCEFHGQPLRVNRTELKRCDG